MSRPKEHTVPQGFATSAGVAATALQRPENRFRLTPTKLRVAVLVLLVMCPWILFDPSSPVPAEVSWLLAVVAAVLCLIAVPFSRSQRRKRQLPLRQPLEANCRDYGDPAPGGGFRKARGNIYMGICRETGEEVWLSQDDCLRHMLILGTTGSGKTATLLGIAANMLASAGGLIYSDAKGSVELYFDIYGLARRLGRDDDVLVMNFMTSQETLEGEKRSNSINLFQGQSSDSLLQIFLSLLPAQQGEGSNSVFAARAESLMAAILPPLVWLRDNENWTLSLNLLSDCLSLNGVIGLASVSKIPETEISPLHAFIESLAGMNAQIKVGGQPQPKPTDEVKITPAMWNRALESAEAIVLRNRDVARAGREIKRRSGWNIPDQPANQHGFASMYFNRPVQSLASTYSDLYDSPWGEIRMEDIIANRRILVIVLPILEKSPAELRGLGKLVLSSIRSAVALGLGTRAEGDRADVIDNLPTRSETICLIILDEIAYQLSEGFAAVPAQSRSLGVGVVFAGQDLAGIRRVSQDEAGQMVANTLTKGFMRLAEPADTADLAIKLGGKTHVRMQTDSGQPSYREVERIRLEDLAAQVEGESHIVFGNKLVRTHSFYPGKTTAKRMMMHRFINIPSSADLAAIIDRNKQRAYEQRRKASGSAKRREADPKAAAAAAAGYDNLPPGVPPVDPVDGSRSSAGRYHRPVGSERKRPRGQA